MTGHEALAAQQGQLLGAGRTALPVHGGQRPGCGAAYLTQGLSNMLKIWGKQSIFPKIINIFVFKLYKKKEYVAKGSSHYRLLE